MSLPNVALATWQAQVDTMSPKKQEAWKASTRDVRGTRHCIRYHNGYFQVKCTARLLGESVHPLDGWAPIIAKGSQPSEEQLQASYGHVLPGGVPELQIPTTETAQLRQALEGCGLEDFDMELFKALLIREMIEENHTGKHHRNRAVAVPTAAGQPVRG